MNSDAPKANGVSTGAIAPGAPVSQPPPSVPGYELLRCIGRGSYGEVWLARDAAGAFRAVKVVYRKTFEHERPFERELSGIRKFEPVSRMHPSQVSILQVGHDREAGYFYYVMELADDGAVPSSEFRVSSSEPPASGEQHETRNPKPKTYIARTLKLDLQRRRRLPFRDCLDISLALTTALDHLHQHGLIHRDIKPSNVIFVRGVPKLADIGLVTDVGATISHVGAEGFLPPEGPGTPQADLYSLGKVLYEISTGQDRLDFPELPTFVDQPAERENLLELNQVFLKACQNDVGRRYQSAREMFADLALLQGGKSLRRARAMEERLARARRVAAFAISIALVAASAIYIIQQRRVQKERQKTALEERYKRFAQNVASDKSRHLSDLYVANGEALEREGDLTGALLWFASALEEDPPGLARAAGHRQRIASLLSRCPKVPALFAHRGAVNSAALSAEGGRFVTAGDDRTAQVWNLDAGEAVGPPLRHAAPVQQAGLSADGARVLTLAGGVVQVWSGLEREAFARKLDHPAAMTIAMFSPGGRQILTVTDQKSALVWEAGSGQLRFTLRHPEQVLCASFSPDGRFVATAGAGRSGRVWSTETGEAISPAMAQDRPVTVVVFSADSRRLATVDGKEARVWDARSGEPAAFRLRHDAAIHAVRFSPDGRWLVTAGEDHTARIWDGRTGQATGTLRHAAPVQFAEFSPDGLFILTASGNRVQLWNALTLEAMPPVLVLGGAVREVHFSVDGDRLAIAAADGTARLVAVEPEPWHWSPATSDEVTHWSQLLAGREIQPSGRMEYLKAEALRHLWQALKLKLPDDFAPAALSAWHQRAGDRCEKAGWWSGARFHWERALAARPDDPTLRERRDRAMSESARSETAAARHPGLPDRLLARPAGLNPQLLDLSKYYNAMLTEQWLPTNVVASGNDLSELPRGVQRFNGIEFDVRGLIQLAGGALENSGGRFPSGVNALPVGRKSRRLHFLHGAAWSALAGTPIGSYVAHFANGERREIKIIFGQNISEWWGPATQPPLTPGAAVAWEGSNVATRGLGLRLRVYQMTWINPLPNEEITAIDFKSALEKPAPFLIAITAE